MVCEMIVLGGGLIVLGLLDLLPTINCIFDPQLLINSIYRMIQRLTQQQSLQSLISTQPQKGNNLTQNTSTISATNNRPSFIQFARHQNSLESNEISELVQNSPRQKLQPILMNQVKRDDIDKVDQLACSKMIEKIRPIIIEKIEDIIGRRNKKSQQTCAQAKEINGSCTLKYYPINKQALMQKINDQCKPKRRCREVSFNQIIALKRFISSQSPSIMQVAVQYHEGLNINQKTTIDPHSSDEEGKCKTMALRGKLSTKKASKKKGSSQK